eukprot:601802-Prorocentrum_minimum.AAC.1
MCIRSDRDWHPAQCCACGAGAEAGARRRHLPEAEHGARLNIPEAEHTRPRLNIPEAEHTRPRLNIPDRG